MRGKKHLEEGVVDGDRVALGARKKRVEVAERVPRTREHLDAEK